MRLWQTPTQQYSYKQDCGVGVSELHVLDRSRSTFFRFDEVGVANRSRFFRFSKLGNRIPWRFRFTLNYFTFLHFISIFILFTRRNVTEALYIGKQFTNYPHLHAPGDAKILLSDGNF